MDDSKTMGVTDIPVQNTSEDMFNVCTYVNGLCTFIGTCETHLMKKSKSRKRSFHAIKTAMMHPLRNCINSWRREMESAIKN